MHKAWLILLILSVGCSSNSSKEAVNKDLVRYFFEESLAKGNLTEYKQRRTSDFVCHAPDGDFNLEQDYQNALEVQRVMKGFKISIVKLISENDMVAVHWQAESAQEIGTGITWFRVSGDKLAEEWPSSPHFKKK